MLTNRAQQMAFAEHDNVIEHLSPQGPNEALGVAVLPRLPRRDAHRLEP